MAVVLTTHDMDDAANLSDYVTIIDKGQVISHGTVAELTGDGSSTLTISATRINQTLLEQFRAYGEVETAKDGSVSITGDFTTQKVHAITGLLNDSGVDMMSMSLASRSLDDVFLDLTGRTLRS